jgi:hypothetical protein
VGDSDRTGYVRLETSKNIEGYGRTSSDRLRGLNRESRYALRRFGSGLMSVARFASSVLDSEAQYCGKSLIGSALVRFGVRQHA